MTIAQPIPRTAFIPMLHLSSFMRLLFLIFTAYLAFPVVDIPGIGLSVSAPLFLLIALEIYLRDQPFRGGEIAFWLVLAYFFVVGIMASLVGNLLTTELLSIGNSELIWTIRYIYWVIVFVTTMIVVVYSDLIKPIVTVMGVMIIVVGVVRLAEGVLFGTFGAPPIVFSQNGYGIRFSTFFPFGLWLFLTTKREQSLLAFAGVSLLTIAVVANLSRGSWTSIGVGSVVFVVLYMASQRGRLIQNQLVFMFVVMVSLVLLSFLPSGLLATVNEHAASFQELEEDESFAVRELMIQKGQRIFEERPLIGIGLGRFRATEVELDLPEILSHSRADFNRASAHNAYLALLAETGLVGTIPFAILLFVLIAVGFPATLALARQGDIWAIPIYVGVLSMSLHLFVLAGLTNTVTWFLYGLLAGVIQRYHLQRRVVKQPSYQPIRQ